MRIVLALLLAAHGIAHFAGFAVQWKLMTSPDIPYRTTIFGGAIDIGDLGERVLGLLWLTAGSAFIAAAASWVAGARLAAPNTVAALILSFVLCMADWPQTRIGMAVNVVIAAGLFAAARVMAGRVFPA